MLALAAPGTRTALPEISTGRVKKRSSVALPGAGLLRAWRVELVPGLPAFCGRAANQCQKERWFVAVRSLTPFLSLPRPRTRYGEAMAELKQFRWVAFLEGLSFVVLLFVAMPLKYWAGLPLAVRVVGMVHGLLFVLFIGMLFRAAVERDWPMKRWGLALLSSLLPFGTFVFDRSLGREIASAAPPST
jgi:integral membrane protein